MINQAKMNHCCNIKNPLLRNGADQQERLMQTLLPAYYKIDSRDLSQLLAFAYHYAECVNYFNTENEKAGDWQCFFEFDIGVLLAVISTQYDPKSLERDYRAKERKFKEDQAAFLDEEDTRCLEDSDPENFRALLNDIYALAKLIAQACQKAPAGHPLKKDIIRFIEKDIVNAEIDHKIQSALVQLISFDKGNPYPTNDYQYFISTADTKEGCVLAWSLNQLCFDCIYPDKNYTLAQLCELFLIFLRVWARIRKKAAYYFKQHQKNNGGYLPHMALFLNFLELFQVLQEGLNHLTARHLDFYYQEVLGLEKKPEQADRVHAVFELAKNFSQYLIPKGTALDAGKDDEGKPMIYRLVDGLMLNKAQVATICPCHIELGSGGLAGVYALPDAHLVFEAKEADTGPGLPSFPPLGGLFLKPHHPMPFGEVGLGVTAPEFFAPGGVNNIRIEFTANNAFPNEWAGNSAGIFHIALSTAEGWIEIPEETGGPLGFNTEIDGNRLVFSVFLQAGQNISIIEPASGQGNKTADQKDKPVLKITLNQDPANRIRFTDLNQFRLDPPEVAIGHSSNIAASWFLIEPFGFTELDMEQQSGLLPLFAPPISTLDFTFEAPSFGEVYGPDSSGTFLALGQDILPAPQPIAAGNLFIGIKDLQPPDDLSLLFQMEEGSGNYEFVPPDIEWSYKKSGSWVKFTPGQIVKDTTKADPNSQKSLLQTGIIKFYMPQDITKDVGGLYWIRASAVPAPPDAGQLIHHAALPNVIGIVAQAEEAQFVNKDNSLAHLDTGLPADTINALLRRKRAVKKVSQPFPSFDGRAPEDSRAFYRRVSERLRHKGRAVTVWDYERLVLEAFPEVGRVRCLNHSSTKSEVAPGFVTLTVTPDFKNKNTYNRLEPGLSLGTLDEIRYFLLQRTNLFVNCEEHLQVVNPLYEEVRVVCCVKFKKGEAQEASRLKLNRALKRFLAPWAYSKRVDMIFNHPVHRSAILNFIEERSYVDYVTKLALLHFSHAGVLLPYYDFDDTQLFPEEIEELIPSTSRSVLTSYQRRPYESFSYDHMILLVGEESLCPDCPDVNKI